jgi:hypothetical protein
MSVFSANYEFGKMLQLHGGQIGRTPHRHSSQLCGDLLLCLSGFFYRASTSVFSANYEHGKMLQLLNGTSLGV